MTYYAIVTNNTLEHHGVIGMKWGIRRYQNYDGTYTQKGVKNFRKSEAAYDEANQKYKSTKKAYKQGEASKLEVRQARSERKDAKRQMSKDYDQVKRDKAGDIGKKLYQSGKTITGNETKLQIASTIAGGAGLAAKLLHENGRDDLAKCAVYIGAGLEAVNAVSAAKNAVEAHYLRAYYGHTRN